MSAVQIPHHHWTLFDLFYYRKDKKRKCAGPYFFKYMSSESLNKALAEVLHYLFSVKLCSLGQNLLKRHIIGKLRRSTCMFKKNSSSTSTGRIRYTWVIVNCPPPSSPKSWQKILQRKSRRSLLLQGPVARQALVTAASARKTAMTTKMTETGPPVRNRCKRGAFKWGRKF